MLGEKEGEGEEVKTNKHDIQIVRAHMDYISIYFLYLKT